MVVLDSGILASPGMGAMGSGGIGLAVLAAVAIAALATLYGIVVIVVHRLKNTHSTFETARQGMWWCGASALALLYAAYEFADPLAWRQLSALACIPGVFVFLGWRWTRTSPPA